MFNAFSIYHTTELLRMADLQTLDRAILKETRTADHDPEPQPWIGTTGWHNVREARFASRSAWKKLPCRFLKVRDVDIVTVRIKTRRY